MRTRRSYALLPYLPDLPIVAGGVCRSSQQIPRGGPSVGESDGWQHHLFALAEHLAGKVDVLLEQVVRESGEDLADPGATRSCLQHFVELTRVKAKPLA